MFVNNFKINLNTLSGSTTATTINIPLTMDFQVVDNSELIQKVFVDTETEKAINPIVDYEKIKFSPIHGNSLINNLTYTLTFNGGGVTYADIGFTNEDIKLNKNSFSHSFVDLLFYDTDNKMTQNLITYITLFCSISTNDVNSDGTVKNANNIYVNFTVSNPKNSYRGKYEGFNIYDYKEYFKNNDYKYLYMRPVFKNAKTGKSINLMTESGPFPIDNLINKLHTRYKLMKNSDGFFYEVDDTYSNNVTYNGNNVIINLFEINAI